MPENKTRLQALTHTGNREKYGFRWREVEMNAETNAKCMAEARKQNPSRVDSWICGEWERYRMA